MPQGKIMEIPQLRAICNDLAVGKSYSRIKELRKVAKSTLQNIKSRLLACGKLEPAALNELDDEMLIKIMYGDKAKLKVAGRKGSHRIVVGKKSFTRIDASEMFAADFAQMVKRFSENRNITKEDLYRDYMNDAIAAGKEHYRRTTFMRLLNACIDNQRGPNVYMHREHSYGDELQIDWCGDQYPILVGQKDYHIEYYGVFVMTWPASYYVYAQFVPNQTTQATCAAIRDGLLFFGCKPLRLVIDNAKQMVTRHKKGHEAILNENFKYFIDRCGFQIDANNPYSPNEKSACERSVELIQTRVLTRMRPGEIRTLDQANSELKEKVKKYINDESFRGHDRTSTRSILFNEHEKPAAIPIVYTLPEFIEHHTFLSVGPDYCVEVNGSLYSVPYTLAGKQVDADVTGGAVIIYHEHKEVGRHPIQPKGHCDISIEHMPEAHKQIATKEAEYSTREKILNIALEYSPKLWAYCDLMLSKGEFAEMRKGCIAVINKYKKKKYQKDILDEALDRTLHECKPERINSYVVDDYIKDLIQVAQKNGGKIPKQTDLFTDPSDTPATPKSINTFIRGNDDLLEGVIGKKSEKKDHE